MTADYVYDPDRCPTCDSSGYAEVHQRREAERLDAERYWRRRFFVYRAYDQDGVLLYIGCTGMPAERWQTHRRESGWAAFAVRFRLAGPYNREQARDLERAAIRTESPLWNVAGRGRRNLVRPEVERYLASVDATA